jgi:hypothetical protein
MHAARYERIQRMPPSTCGTGASMAYAITSVDETTSGERTHELTLEFLNERVTAREIIRSRVYQEVTEYNARRTLNPFIGLVQPADEERVLNGAPRRERRVDWEAQCETALRAFERNGFLLLVDDRQIVDLDEEVDLRPDTVVSFLKLVPLIGG